KIDVKGYDLESHAKVPKVRLPHNINTEKDLEDYLLGTYVIEEYMGNPLDFVVLYNHLFTVFVNCYPITNLRNYTIKFKLYNDDEMEYGLPFKKFMLTLPIFGALQLVW